MAEAIGDDGLDRDFTAIDLGGNLLDIVHYLDVETEAVLIVDSAHMGLSPGEFAFFTTDQVATRKELAGFSTHEGDLLKVLDFAASLERPLPPITILGIEPLEICAEHGLSSALEGRLREYVDAAVGFFAAVE